MLAALAGVVHDCQRADDHEQYFGTVELWLLSGPNPLPPRALMPAPSDF
jgi:hypothetical protein